MGHTPVTLKPQYALGAGMGHLNRFHALGDGVWFWRRFLCAVGPAETDSPVASSAAEHGVGGSAFGAAVPSRRDCGDDSVTMRLN